MPNAWKAGFRIENEAENFYAAIVENLPIAQTEKVSFPCRQTFLAIRQFLFTAAEYDSANQPIPKTVWCEAVAYSNLQEEIAQTKDNRNKESKRAKK